MVRLLARLNWNFLSFARHEDTLLALSRRYFLNAEDRERAYARYDKPAYLRRRKIVDAGRGGAPGGALAL